MYCRKCGAEIPAESKFCTRCGTKVVTIEAAKTIDADTSNVAEDAKTTDAITATETVEAAGANDTADATDATDAIGAAETTNTAEATVSTISAVEQENEKPAGITAESSDAAEHPSAAADLAQAVASTKNRSRRRVPLIVLVALGIALAAGTAYAAYYVYTEIVVPALEAQQQQAADANQQGATEEGAESEAEPAAEEEPAIVEATGNPQNFLQIAEILAMDPKDIPAYLESQGLVEKTVTNSDSGVTQGEVNAVAAEGVGPVEETAWTLNGNANTLLALDPDGKFFKQQTYAGDVAENADTSFGLKLGKNVTHGWTYVSSEMGFGTDLSASDLESGDSINSIALSIPAFNLNNEELKDFASLCGLGEPLANYTPTYCYLQLYSDAAYQYTSWVTGASEINGKTYYWYLELPSAMGGLYGFTSSTFGIVDESVVQDYVLYTAIHTEDAWNNANTEDHALMLAQCLAQSLNTGNGGGRVNVITGEREYLVMDGGSATNSDGISYATHHWVKHGEEGAYDYITEDEVGVTADILSAQEARKAAATQGNSTSTN